MNAVAKQFDGLNHRIVVPRSIPPLVTQRLLVMDFIDGIPITKMKDQAKFQNLSEATKRLAARQILSKVSEAYGRMILLDGLFQADGHPGNILVMKGGRIGLIDYGQSKKLPDRYRLPFAKMVLALEKKDDAEICGALDRLGVETTRKSRRGSRGGCSTPREPSIRLIPTRPSSRCRWRTFPATCFSCFA